jgi:hypothetical protein
MEFPDLIIYKMFTEDIIGYEKFDDINDKNDYIESYLSGQDGFYSSDKKIRVEIEAAKLLQFLTMMKNANVNNVKRNIRYLKDYVEELNSILTGEIKVYGR